MNEMIKTGVILGGAAVLAVIAASVGPKEAVQDLYSDEGEVFFPDFTDTATAVNLEVTEFSAEQATARKFAVSRDNDGRWTIPSHGGYPADAKDQMGKAAAMLVGLTKDSSKGDLKDKHVDFGVVDPLDKSADPAGRGTRVTMKDSSGNVLADLIVGKEVSGKLDVFYVRMPGKRRVYTTKLEGELSTSFSDWIETDLLKATSYDIQKVVFDNYSVDEQRGQIVKGEKYEILKDDGNKWTVVGLDAEKEEPNEDRLREIGDTLTQIKIVGVRQKPKGLTAALEKATGFDRQILSQILADKGFFLASGGKLFSNEGDLIFETKKGVRYTLRFGELVPGEGDAVSSGTVGAKPPKPGETGPQPITSNNRYLMVSAEFIESLIKAPSIPRLPKEHMDQRRQARELLEKLVAAIDAYRKNNGGAMPESLAKLTEKPEGGEALLAELPKDPWGGDYLLNVEGDSFAVVSYGEDKALGGDGVATDIRNDAFQHEDDLRRAADEWGQYDTKLEDGREEADNLTKRFGPWYYVIDKTLFDKLKPKREDLVKLKTPDPTVPDPKAPGDGK